jgi:hypothetical protein
MKTAIFLGAGASMADGAPSQASLFKDYFNLHNQHNYGDNTHESYDRLCCFFDHMFQINIASSDLGQLKFPTFEEVLGVLDIADIKNESFRNFSIRTAATNSGDIDQLRLDFIFLMAEVIHKSLIGR